MSSCDLILSPCGKMAWEWGPPSLPLLTLLHTPLPSIPHIHTLPFYCLLCSHFISCPSLSLQSFLKGLYISWLTSKPVRLEPLLAELLTDMRLPSINCLPIKKPFGALKEVVLHPIHEDTTLPYTSTAAIQLLRSVGRTCLKFLLYQQYTIISAIWYCISNILPYLQYGTVSAIYYHIGTVVLYQQYTTISATWYHIGSRPTALFGISRYCQGIGLPLVYC